MARAKLYIAFLVCVNLYNPLGLVPDLSYHQGLGHVLANEETNYKILMSAVLGRICPVIRTKLTNPQP